MAQDCVVAVVLNTNRREDTVECLASLKRSSYDSLKCVLLDNGSTDGTVECVRQRFPEVRIVELVHNRGYAGNNNTGIDVALAQGADWVLILNEDTVVAPDCVERLVKVGSADRKNGIVGPMVYHYDEPEVIQSAGGRIDLTWNAVHIAQNEVDRGFFKQPRQVDWVSGCCMMVRRAVVEEVGRLDERFFYYWEETEWCLRARRQGWRIVHVPDARVWHKGVQRDYRPKPAVTYYSTRNRLLMMSKHKAPLTAWIMTYIQVVRTLSSWSLRPKWRPMRAHRDAMWNGLMDFARGKFGGLTG